MKFLKFATYLKKLEKTRSRNDMVVILAGMYKEMNISEVEKATYMLQGRVAPAFLPIEFSFSNKLIIKALGSLMNNGLATMQKEFKFLGDIGLVAEELYHKQSSGMELLEVYAVLEEISILAGKNSQAEKTFKFIELGKKVGGLELKYISRILVGSLRLGLSIKTILDGLSWAISGTKGQREMLERAYGVRCDLGLIAKLALGKNPETKLKKIKTEVGVPVAVKLVEREKTLEDIFARVKSCYVQPKYDGLRVEIHYSKNGFPKYLDSHDLTLFEETEAEKNALTQHVRIFSRNFEDLTPMFPELGLDVAKLDVESVILDGETIGFNPLNDEFLAFQDTIKRKRKYNIARSAEKFPVEVHVFDIIELNGKDLLYVPIEKRLKILKDLFAGNKTQHFKVTTTDLVDNVEKMKKLFEKYVKQNLEGIIVKNEGTLYLPGTRNFDWIKFKSSYRVGIKDTMDTVVLGYYLGEGSRTKFGIGAILVGVYDEKRDLYLSLAKVGTGMKDADWPIIKDAINKITVPKLPVNVKVTESLIPDVIARPEIIAVIDADSITKSKMHTQNDANDKGFSLRFPRLKKFGREDKTAQDCTTLSELVRLFELQ